jgi:tetratricopeptide (TPR) repeat protein
MPFIPILGAATGVDWTLLAVAGFILFVGGLCLVLVLRSRTRQRPARTRRPEPKSQNRVREPTSKVEYRQGYDRAFRAGDFIEAARIAHQIHDNRLYAEAIEHAGDLERAIAAWMECREYERAAQLFQKVGKLGKAGQVYLQAGRHQRAAQCFEQAGEWQRAADIYRSLGNEKKANSMEAKAHIERGRHLEAAKCLILNEDMLGAAEQLLKGGDPKKAVEAFRRGGRADLAARLLVKEERFADAALLFEEASEWSQAASCYEQLGEMADRERCMLKSGNGYDAGRLAYERGEMERALSLFEAIPTVDERYFDAGLYRGQVYERMGKLLEAADAYNLFLQVREANPNNRVLFTRVAQILEGIGRPREALKTVGRLLTAGLATPELTAWAGRLEDAAYVFEETEAIAAPAKAHALDSKRSGTARIKEGDKGSWPGVPPHLMGPPEASAVDALSERYRFGECMGQGGNGIVYRATDLALGRDVVVKFLHQSLLPTDVARDYFVREAKTAAKLHHPNIVTIFDIGEEAGMLFYSMELVEGRTLADCIIDDGGMLTHKAVLPIAQSLCNALQYAHDKQVIHRDIKPSNVMVSTSGQVKLLDFGLAKALDENPDKSVFLCGTPFYMSPEQIRRDFLDHRTDIYSLGCLLFVMYTGDVPFPKGNVFQHHQQTEPPDPRTRVPNMPAGAAEVLLKTLDKDRNKRFQQANDVALALSQVE